MVERATTLLLAPNDPGFLQHRPIHRGTRDRGRHSLDLVACRCAAFARAAGRRRGRGDEAADHRVDRVPWAHRGGQPGQCLRACHGLPREAAVHRGEVGEAPLTAFAGLPEADSRPGAKWRSSATLQCDHGGPPAHAPNGPAGSQSGYDSARTRRAWKPQLQAAQAQVNLAEITLPPTSARHAGKISRTAVTEGNVVSPGTLATIVSQIRCT